MIVAEVEERPKRKKDGNDPEDGADSKENKEKQDKDAKKVNTEASSSKKKEDDEKAGAKNNMRNAMQEGVYQAWDALVEFYEEHTHAEEDSQDEAKKGKVKGHVAHRPFFTTFLTAVRGNYKDPASVGSTFFMLLGIIFLSHLGFSYTFFFVSWLLFEIDDLKVAVDGVLCYIYGTSVFRRINPAFVVNVSSPSSYSHDLSTYICTLVHCTGIAHFPSS